MLSATDTISRRHQLLLCCIIAFAHASPLFGQNVSNLSTFISVPAASVRQSDLEPSPTPILPERLASRSPLDPGTDPTTDSETLDRLHGQIFRDDLLLGGAASCAAASCHGGPRTGVAQPRARRGSEYQLWLERDPHARSWKTFCGPKSVRMMEQLGILRNGEVVDQSGYDNCLACHNTTLRFTERPSDQFLDDSNHAGGFSREGVGCASCHGPSELWIGSHYTRDWHNQSAIDGFVPASNLYVRARMCASCHVGDKDRDMNHDIIAAGHPALRYEFATYHAMLPKHWRDPESANEHCFEAQLWIAGQIAAADASLSLIESRATDSHTVSEWPELSSYNCSSCHHELGLTNDRKPFERARNSIAPFSNWNDAGLRWLLELREQNGESMSEDTELLSSLDAVRQRMESSTSPSRAQTAAAARNARRALASWFDGLAGENERCNFNSDRLGLLVATAAGQRQTFDRWETATQFYLAAVAARSSWPGGPTGPQRSTAERLRVGLRYPEILDVARYAKLDAGPTLNGRQARELGIQLAEALGTVAAEPAPKPDNLPGQIEERYRAEVEKIEQTLTPLPRSAEPKTDEPTPGKRTPRNNDELLQELRDNIDDLLEEE